MATDYDALATAAEQGKLQPKPGTTTLRGADAAAASLAAILEATGASSPAEAARLAVGRPRLGTAPTGPSRQWRVRASDDLYEAVETQAAKEGVTVSDLVRRAAVEYLATHANAS